MDTATAPTSAPTASAPVAEASTSAPVADTTPTPSAETSPSAVVDSNPTGGGESILSPSLTPTDTQDSSPASGVTIETTDANVNWMEKAGLNDDLRNNPNISKYNTLEDALNANVNLVKKLGEKGIMRPDENAGEDAWNAWYDHLGRPDSPEGYGDYEVPTEVDAEGNAHPLFEVDKDMYAEAKKEFYNMGLNPQQAKAVMDLYVNNSLSQANEDASYNAEVATQTRAKLEKEWGGEMKAKVTTAINIADKLGIKDTLISKGLGNDYEVIKMLDSIADKVGESRITGDVSAHGGGFHETLANLKKHPAYRDKSHPEHHAVRKREIDLYAKHYN